MHIVFNLELAVFVERQQVHRREVTRGIIQEHILGTWVRATDRAIFWAGVPCVHSVVVLDAWIGTGPSGVANSFPQITGADDLGDLTVLTVDQLPIFVVLNSLQKRISDADGVIRVLTRNG